MKKTVALVLTFVLLAFAFVGCTKKENDVPDGMKEASNDIVDYDLYVPATWTVDVSTGMISAYYSAKDPSNVSMTAFNIDNEVSTIDEYFERYKQDFESTFENFEQKETVDMLLDGIAAKKYTYTGTIGSEDYTFMQVVTIRRSMVYIFTYTAISENFDLHTEEVELMIENFKFN